MLLSSHWYQVEGPLQIHVIGLNALFSFLVINESVISLMAGRGHSEIY